MPPASTNRLVPSSVWPSDATNGMAYSFSQVAYPLIDRGCRFERFWLGSWSRHATLSQAALARAVRDEEYDGDDEQHHERHGEKDGLQPLRRVVVERRHKHDDRRSDRSACLAEHAA